MSFLHSRRLWEQLLYVVVLALAIATLLYTGDVKPGNGDALGPVAFPRYAACLLLCLLAIKAVQSRKAVLKTSEQSELTSGTGRLKVLGMLLIIIGFIALVSSQWLPFWATVTLFLIASINFMNASRNWRGLLLIAVFAVVFGTGLSYIVHTLFYFSL